MKKKKEYRHRLVKVLLTAEEYAAFEASFQKTTFRLLSDYHRALLFGNPVTIYYRNRSLDEFLNLAGQMVNMLQAIDRNWARAISHLRDHPPDKDHTAALNFLLSEEFAVLGALEHIRSRLLNIYKDESQNKNVCGDE